MTHTPADENTSSNSASAARIRQTKTLESIGRLAGGIAHDFNNLLTSILGYSELLDDQLRLRGNTRSERNDLREIRQAAERARELTQRLLAFSRRMPVSQRLIDPHEVVKGVERLLRRFSSENIQMSLALSAEQGYVVADPTQLEQVLLSLCVNGCDAMPDGGTLVIQTQWRDIPTDGLPAGEVIGVPDVLPDACIEISVSDTGHGMDADFVHSAFEPFVTTKKSDASTGLGLSAAYGIVMRAGGTMIVDSVVGEGTTVRVLLPRVQAGAGEADSDRAYSGKGGGATILLAEDDVDVRTLNVRTLREAGYHVLVAEDGSIALEIAARPGVHLDLVITDIVMPGRNGWEVAEGIQAEHPEIPVLFVSGFAPASLNPRKLPERGFPFLAKPFTPSELLHRVRELLDSAPSLRSS